MLKRRLAGSEAQGDRETGRQGDRAGGERSKKKVRGGRIGKGARYGEGRRKRSAVGEGWGRGGGHTRSSQNAQLLRFDRRETPLD